MRRVLQQRPRPNGQDNVPVTAALADDRLIPLSVSCPMILDSSPPIIHGLPEVQTDTGTLFVLTSSVVPRGSLTDTCGGRCVQITERLFSEDDIATLIALIDDGWQSGALFGATGTVPLSCRTQGSDKEMLVTALYCNSLMREGVTFSSVKYLSRCLTPA